MAGSSIAKVISLQFQLRLIIVFRFPEGRPVLFPER